MLTVTVTVVIFGGHNTYLDRELGIVSPEWGYFFTVTGTEVPTRVVLLYTLT